MSDTPTLANLLTQWLTGGSVARESVYANLRNDPAEAAAIEAFVRDELNSLLPARRVIAAEALVEVYRDEHAAVVALAWVLRQREGAVTAEALEIVQRLQLARAVALLRDLAVHAVDAFCAIPSRYHRWVAGMALEADRGEHGTLAELLLRGDARTVSALLVGVGCAASTSKHGVDAGTEEFVRVRLFHPENGYAAGAMLWRLTWRIHRDWLASIDPHSPQFENDSSLLVLVTEVLTEHLGRRPDLAPVVRALVVRLGAAAPETVAPVAQRLARLGARGWAVLLPIMGDTTALAQVRAVVFAQAVKYEKVWPLAQHHAHSVILERTRDRTAITPELLQSAGMVLYSLGRVAGSATPDILDLIVKQPDTAGALARVLAFIVSGFPNPAATVARTLDRLRRSVVFAPDAFARLAGVYAWLNLDGGPALVEDTSLDPRTPECVLQQTAWKEAPPDVRRRHALKLANSFGSPRPEVQARAAIALRHYPDQLPAVWPALVALLTSGDEKAVLLAFPLFRHLGPVTDDATTELSELFRETNSTYAARAVVALWRLGRIPLATDQSRTDDAWGWAVFHAVANRVPAHGQPPALSKVFAVAPREIAAKIHTMLNPPELEEEIAISAHVPRLNDPTSSQMVNWNGVYQSVGNDPEGGLLFVALMSAFGSEGFGAQKIWLIKHCRTLTGTGLADAKRIVEFTMERLTATATLGEKRACVRDYFPLAVEVPPAVTDLLGHRIGWYRWAGLELLDAWGAPERVAELIEDRIWDRSAIVRVRALRMNHG